MAFEAGKNTQVLARGYDLSSYFFGYDVGGTQEVGDTTTFGKNSRTKIPTLKDGQITLDGYADNSAGSGEAVFNAAFGAEDSVITIYPDGSATVGSLGYAMTADVTEIGFSDAVDGIVSYAVSAASNTGVEGVKSLYGGNKTGTGNGSTLDNSAATTNGGSAYLHVTAFNGTDCTIAINGSTDNFSADDTQLVAFTQVTGVNTAERVTFTGTVKRYLRVVFTGTFTSVTVYVGVHRA